MSYTRFGEDSDTYTLCGMAGFICISCRLAPMDENNTHDNATFGSMRELVEHLHEHIKYQHKVPRRELKALYKKMKNNEK